MIDEELSKLYHYMSTWADIYNKNIKEKKWFENDYNGMFYLLEKTNGVTGDVRMQEWLI